MSEGERSFAQWAEDLDRLENVAEGWPVEQRATLAVRPSRLRILGRRLRYRQSPSPAVGVGVVVGG